jgi:hypothetical protein
MKQGLAGFSRKAFFFWPRFRELEFERSTRYGVQGWMCCLLHRPVDLVAYPRHGRWQAGRGALFSADSGQSLPAFWPCRTAGGLPQPSSEQRDVRHQ